MVDERATVREQRTWSHMTSLSSNTVSTDTISAGAFSYETSPDSIRADLVDAYRRAWEHVATPGTCLTGAQRVAVAKESRLALGCALCRERKQALSPFSIEGEHDHAGILEPPMVDEIHRVTTDAARLTESWFRTLIDDGLSAEAYVEALGVAVLVISIDRFHHALGLPLEPLPSPRAGEPSHTRVKSIVEGEAWVPMQPALQAGREAGFPGPAPFVMRALSLVPDEVRAWRDVSDVQYVASDDMMSFGRGRAIDRSQIELVAGRVSALNECFY